MTYDEIKGALREADRCAQADAYELADSMVREVLNEGGTRHDVHTNLSPDSLRRLRDWARGRQAAQR